MFKKLLVATFSSLIFLSSTVCAVGLGDIEQASGLNQPLRAEIKLLSPGDLAEYEVVASIASQSAFDKSGIDKPFFLNKIKFKTVRNSRGELVIKVTTHDAVKEPFLNFLIELNTPAQQFYREYTLLLDPPIFEEVTSSTIEKSKSDNQTYSQPDSERSNQSNNAEPYAPQARSNSGESDEDMHQSYSGSQYGPVSSTDTLWSIASKVRPSRDVSIHQTLVAIYRANPEAFSNGNINNLLKGKVLDIPTATAIQNVPQRAALQDVVMQNRQWRSGGARNIVDQTSNYQSGDSRSNRGSRLSLATANEGGEAKGYGADTEELNELQDELVKTQEESATLKAENDELRARLAEILAKAEGTQGEDSLGLDVEDTELALLGKNTEQLDEASNDASASEQSDPELLVDTHETAENSDSSIAASETNNNESDEQNSLAEAKPKVPMQVVNPAKEKSLIDTILASGTLLWGGIAGLVLIILILVFWRMKKRMEDDSFQDDLVASAGGGSMDTTEMFELPDVGDDMLVELEMDDEDESEQSVDGEAFDPLGEADIYIAYGKIDQAETLLLEAIEDNPIRSDYKVKLMECYAESDNKESFDKLEAEVNDAVDADEWSEQIAQLKNKAWEVEGGEESDDDEFDLPSTEDIFGEDDEEDEEFDIDLSDESDDSDKLNENDEFDLNFEDKDDFDEEGKQGESTLDDLDDLESLDDLEDSDTLESLDNLESLDELDNLDSLDDLDSMDDLELDDKSTASEELDDLNFDVADDLNDEPLASIGDDSSLTEDNEFSLDIDDEIELDDELLKSDSTGDELSINIENDEEVSLDIDNDFNFEDDADDNIDFGETLSDEIATKLDLARAYVDMGDLDGAKEILTEVVADGTDKQKSEAQELIDKC